MATSKYREFRFFCFPGLVGSRNDGEFHHISPPEVAQLYGLNPNAPNVFMKRHGEQNIPKDGKTIILIPRTSGNYVLEDEVRRQAVGEK